MHRTDAEVQDRPCEADGPLEVNLSGDIDVASVDVIARAASIAAETRRAALVLDLSKVEFMDSEGVEALLAARRRLDEGGGQLILREPPRCVRRVLEVCGIADYFTVESS